MYSEYVLLSASKLHTLKTDLSETNRKTIEKQVKELQKSVEELKVEIAQRTIDAKSLREEVANRETQVNELRKEVEVDLEEQQKLRVGAWLYEWITPFAVHLEKIRNHLH